MADSERTRLHITPFNAGLYDIVVPKSLQPAATGVSFHTVQTFPERGFGYIELPKADADKLRKKLNGFILRGAKMNIQEAKPDKRRRDKEDDAQDEKEEKPRKKPKKEKSKKKDKEITGFELPDNRHIKRGWTEEAGKSKKSEDKKDKDGKSVKREKSKYISGKEVLFKQKMPKPVALAENAEATEKKDKKSKKPKHHVVIHEFEKTKKHPSFLKSEASTKTGTASEFVEGKGWVDSEGNVIEEVHVNPKREDRIAQIPEVPMEVRISKPAPKQPVAQSTITAGAKSLEKFDGVYNSDSESEDVSAESSIISSSSESEDESESEAEEEQEQEEEEEVEQEKEVKKVVDPVPATKEDSDSESEAEAGVESESEPEKPEKSESEDDQEEQTDAMDVDEKSAHPSTPRRDVHPLEALFKRPRPESAANETPRPAPINTSFSFFDTADDDEAVDTFPHTPFNMDEPRGRGMRSAAPTPDTAAIGRKFSFSLANHADIEEEDEEAYDQEDEDDANQVPLGVKSAEDGDDDKEETEFAKWFWESRGDTNRGWKKRRRDMLKQKRQRENRRLSRRVI